MRLLAWLLCVHALVDLGLHRDVQITERIARYPQHVLEAFTTNFPVLLPAVLFTGAYLTGALVLSWLMLPVFRRLPDGALWVSGKLPAFLYVIVGIVAAFELRRHFGFVAPVDGFAPWMVALTVTCLALPVTARIALTVRGRVSELQRADFTRTARAVGLPERRVRAGVLRVVRPEALGLLAGEAVGLAVAMAIIEGLFNFPGLGLQMFRSFAGVFGGVGGYAAGALNSSVPFASGAALYLLLLAGVFTGVLSVLAARLDPRRHP